MNKERIKEVIEVFATAPGYLEQTGWLRSMERGAAVDSEGQPIPWITYPALYFLRERVSPAMAVFEYGTGNSTLWWERRVMRLVSCEHDKEWFASYKGRVMESTSYLLRRCKGGSTEYAKEIQCYREMFDILVIDGRDRIACARNCLSSLRVDGVIVWDNSDRSEDQPGYDFLVEAGFKRLDFWGLGPLSTRCWCTSIFYRDKNCLNL